MGSRFFISFAALVAAFLIFYFGAWDQFKKLRVIGEEIHRAEKSFSQSEKVALELREAQVRLQENQKQLSNIDSIFLRDGNIEDAVFTIEKLATSHGLALVDIRLQEKYAIKTSERPPGVISFAPSGKKQKSIASKTFALPVSARLGGGYDSFKIFLESIGKTLPLIGIPELTVSPPVNPESQLFLFDIRFVLYGVE